WDAQTGKEIRTLTLKGYPFPVFSMAFSPDGKRIVTGSGDEVKVWNAHSGQEILSPKARTHRVQSVCFSPDGKRIASGGGFWDKKGRKMTPGEVKVWDAQTGKAILTLKGHTFAVSSVVFSPDGKRIASGSGTRWGPPSSSRAR